MLVIYGSKDFLKAKCSRCKHCMQRWQQDDNVPPTQPRNMVRLLESAGQLVRLMLSRGSLLSASATSINRNNKSKLACLQNGSSG